MCLPLMPMKCGRPARYLLALLVAALVPSAASAGIPDPLRFFEGRTESMATMRIINRSPVVSRWVGYGTIKADGSLQVVQHVNEQGRPDFDRWWQIREVGPDQFAGTMSEATGPVTIERIGAAYRFRFRMKKNLSAEQWLTPLGETAARTRMTIRKFGVTVGHSEGWIRKMR